MQEIYWIGSRVSDIRDTGDFFHGSVCQFGNNQNHNVSYTLKRGNQNIKDKDLADFYTSELYSIISRNPESKFLFYNPNIVYQMGKEIIQNTLCLNDYYLLSKFSSKIQTRKYFINITQTIPSIVSKKKFITYKRITSAFENSNQFIIQVDISGGGVGTYLTNENNFDLVKSYLNEEDEYLISPYISNSYSLNVHAIIAKNGLINIFPASIQLTEEIENKILYKGAEFFNCMGIDKKLKHRIFKKTYDICKKIQNDGYVGIIGIDYLVDKKNELYFVEVNNRFQASTDLLNKVLFKEYNTSLQQLNYDAFYNDKYEYLDYYNLMINYNSYYYYVENDAESLEYKYKQLNHYKNDYHIEICDDGYNIDKCSSNSYGYKVVFNNSIASISPDNELWINENIKASSSTLFSNYHTDMLSLKIALINQGVEISTNSNKNLKKAVYGGVDFSLSKDFNIYHFNCPYNINYSNLSPFLIEKDWLYYLNKRLFPIYVEKSKINKDSKTKSGKKYDSIIYISSDRLRVKTIAGCQFKENDIGCSFCDVPGSCTSFSIDDIKESIHYAYENFGNQIHHFLIGGGTDFRKEYWDLVIEIVKYIKTQPYFPQEITLMSVPPTKERMKILKTAGISDVSINIEVFDEDIATSLMPGKGKNTRKQYMQCLKSAKEIWVEDGKVRSMIIVGLEPRESLLKLVDLLTKNKIQPVLSIFRPLPGTPLANDSIPPNNYLKTVYLNSIKICKENNFRVGLGPECKPCQNNILVI
jgi:hypothetical protein